MAPERETKKWQSGTGPPAAWRALGWPRASSVPAQAEPLRLSYFVWPGYGPFFVAQEKGFFARGGVEVELINIEDHGAVVAGLSSGQIYGVLGALQDAATFSQPGEPMVCVLLTTCPAAPMAFWPRTTSRASRI